MAAMKGNGQDLPCDNGFLFFFFSEDHMRLIITRHGETNENALGIAQGHYQGTLSEKGKEQAKKLAERLKNEKIDVIYSSDLIRAEETADEVTKQHPEAKRISTRELREVSFGIYEGKPLTVLTEPWLDVKKKFYRGQFTFEHGEAVDAVVARLTTFLDTCLHQHRHETVLLVCHGTMLGILLTIVMGKKPSDAADFERFENTSVTVFDIDETKNHTLLLLNSSDHLKP